MRFSIECAGWATYGAALNAGIGARGTINRTLLSYVKAMRVWDRITAGLSSTTSVPRKWESRGRLLAGGCHVHLAFGVTRGGVRYAEDVWTRACAGMTNRTCQTRCSEGARGCRTDGTPAAFSPRYRSPTPRRKERVAVQPLELSVKAIPIPYANRLAHTLIKTTPARSSNTP